MATFTAGCGAPIQIHQEGFLTFDDARDFLVGYIGGVITNQYGGDVTKRYLGYARVSIASFKDEPFVYTNPDQITFYVEEVA